MSRPDRPRRQRRSSTDHAREVKLLQYGWREFLRFVERQRREDAGEPLIQIVVP